MKTITSLRFISYTPTVVALGCFDGVHLGHEAVIRQAKQQAQKLNCLCAVWSFVAPPKNYFLPHSVSLLTDHRQKRTQMRRLGVELYCCPPFGSTIASLSAEDFFQTILLQNLKVRHIVCGYNYTFGKGGKGTVAQLQALCTQNGIGLTVLSPVAIGDQIISSSAIRTALSEGRPQDAAAMLGRPYSLCGTVIDGQKLARNLGFPTCNQTLSPDMTLPAFGVYLSRIHIQGRKKVFWGITNIGRRPTVGGSDVHMETHLFDFEGSLYGKQICTDLIAYLRPERPFENLDDLSAQVNQDIRQAKEEIAQKQFFC